MLAKKQSKKQKQQQKKTQKIAEGSNKDNKQKQKQKQKQQETKIKQKQITLNKSIKQPKEQQKQTKPKGDNNKQYHQVQVLINANTLLPNNPNLTMLKTLQSLDIEEQSIAKFYASVGYEQIKYVFHPYLVDTDNKQNKIRILFSTSNTKTYKQVFIDIPTEYIHKWVLQIFYNLHPHKISYNNSSYLFFQIKQTNIHFTDTPFLHAIHARNDKLSWQNPMKVLISNIVKSQKQYLEQLYTFGQHFVKIKQFQDLERVYYEKNLQPYQKQIYSITNLTSKIHNQLICSQLAQKQKKKQIIQDGPITTQIANWICNQINVNIPQNIYLHYRASSCLFDPRRFWEVVGSLSKEDTPHQLLVLQIQKQKSNNILLAFHSTQLTQNIQNSKQSILSYIADANKKSIILNISTRTIHHLVDSQYAYGFSSQVLLCIGKCDVILSAYNITNLCYFPISYASDPENVCASSDGLCGRKRFRLKEVYLYRFLK